MIWITEEGGSFKTLSEMEVLTYTSTCYKKKSNKN